MKSRFVIRLLAVMVVFYSCKDSKAQKNDWEKEGLKGRVKSIKETIYLKLDTLGEIIKGEIPEHMEIKLNKKGNVIETRYYNSNNDSCTTKWIYSYDEKGNQVEANRYNSDGLLYSKDVYKFDDKGNKLEENHYQSNDSLINKYTSKYKKMGNLVEYKSYAPDSSFICKVNFKYDNKGNMIEENDNYQRDDSLCYKTTYKYDVNGNKVERNFYNSDGSLSINSTFKYLFDTNGNWIKRVEYRYGSKTPYRITEREITYY